ncbi:MAG: hypothetical protein COY40_00020 [Alphaproteobacteria bacterium CG_4_10_14_0_8_um_filter_53_9]|nr:MAG: hypothetical protein COY40_00020 [Alphaproteobacteria bacterium CG_4_10_14_0_8_um_filter_53_9]
MWIILSFVLLCVSLLQTQANQHFQIHAHYLNFWRSLLSTLCLFPLFFIVPVDTDQSYQWYLMAFLTGVLSHLVSIMTFDFSKRYSGHIAGAYLPISTILIFIFWGLFELFFINTVSHSPLYYFLGITGLALASGTHLFAKKGLPRDVLWGFIRVSLFAGIVVVLSKFMNAEKVGLSPLLLYSAIIMLTQTVLSYFGMLAVSHKISLPKKREWTGISLLSVLAVIGCPLSWAAIWLSPNPAFVSIILMLCPVILMTYNRRFHRISLSEVIYIGLLVLSAILVSLTEIVLS